MHSKNSLRSSCGFGRFCLLAFFVGASLVIAALHVNAAGLRVVNRSYPGIHFGSFTGGTGTFALYIREDNTGVFLAYLPAAGIGVSNPNLTVSDSGQFSFTRSEGGASLTVSGVIAADGAVSGTMSAASTFTFSGTRSATTGPTQELAGFYQAGANDSAAVALVVVSAPGPVFVLTQRAGSFGGGMGSAFSAPSTPNAEPVPGQITVSAAGPTITGSINGDSGTISLSWDTVRVNGGRDVTVARQRLVNISARARVATGDNIAIAGFVIGGEEAKPVLIRAVGPTLASFGVAGTLAAPRLDVMRGSILVATNTGVARAANATALAAAARQAGAFALGSSGADAAIVTTLHPGNYTAQVSSATGAAGIALIEVYDLSATAAGQKLLNLSTRGATGADEAMLTAGFVIPPGPAKRVLIRGVGPGLTRFGVQGALTSANLSLLSGATAVAQNSNWSASADANAITNGSAQIGAFSLSSGDAAIIATLTPGNYTAQLAGVGNAAGVGLIEVYELTVGDWNYSSAVSGNLLTESDLARLRSFSPMPPPPPEPSNAYADDPAAATLGQKFFFDRGYAGPLGPIGVTGGHGALGETGKVSCNTCHTAQTAFVDRKAISAGATGLQERNTMTLINGVYYDWFNWNGARDSFWIAATAPGSANGSLLSVAHRVYDAYRE